MKNIPVNYQDIVLELTSSISASIDDIFYLQDLQRRKMYLNDEINSASVSEIVRHILRYNSEDKNLPVEERKPIILYITSIGGDVDAGFELIDVIMASKTPVYSINLGWQYSMGFLVGISGHRRYSSINSKILIHDGAEYIMNSGSKVRDYMEFNKQTEERVKNHIISRSKITSDEYDDKLRCEWYMYANEAKEKGFVDYIIGEDVELEEII